MITLAWYLLKVIICSGILCGYYYIALRNKIFHRWNRFYLLASVVLALSVPLMKINIFRNADADRGTVIKVLQTINSGDEIIIEYNRHGGLQFTSENMVKATYLLITIIFLSAFFISLYKIIRLKKNYPETKHEGINFITTDAKGTPFSFFNFIFWNNAIDIYSRQGQQIFNHEIAHVREKHSYDKVFMNITLIFFWINPFFWLIQKELGMIHEFIADKEALEDDDISAFAEMILQTVYPGKQFSLTNNFFHSPLKRRLIMFTKNKNPKVSYLSRLLVLPLAAIVFLAFTLKMKTNDPINKYEGKIINVVIDAGHGGDDNGAIENNVKEKDLNLAIAKEIKQLNKNENINIILSREGDETKSVRERVNFADEKKADLFISIHVDAEENKNAHNGLVVFIPKNDNSYLQQSKLLGSALIESFKNNYSLNVGNDLIQREQNIWVLKENRYPAVLLETGFLSSSADLNYLTNLASHKIIAQNILNGIEKYAEENASTHVEIKSSTNSTNSVSSEPKILARLAGSATIYDSISKVSGQADTIIINANDNPANSNISGEAKGSIDIRVSQTANDPIYFVDGKEIPKAEMKLISPQSIESINVLKGESGVALYGERARNGVVLISQKDVKPSMITLNNTTFTAEPSMVKTSKKNTITKAIPVYLGDGRKSDIEVITSPDTNVQTDTIPDKLFTKVEYEAEFPGGHEAWIKYIVSKVQANKDSLKNEDFGTCVVKFIVNKDGNISNVEATTMQKTQLAKIAVEAVRTGPKWVPAKQNGQIVASYRLQPVTLTQPN